MKLISQHGDGLPNPIQPEIAIPKGGIDGVGCRLDRWGFHNEMIFYPFVSNQLQDSNDSLRAEGPSYASLYLYQDFSWAAVSNCLLLEIHVCRFVYQDFINCLE